GFPWAWFARRPPTGRGSSTRCREPSLVCDRTLRSDYTVAMAADRPRLPGSKASSASLKARQRPGARERHSPRQNHLLAALPAADFERIDPHLELVPMSLGDVL